MLPMKNGYYLVFNKFEPKNQDTIYYKGSEYIY